MGCMGNVRQRMGAQVGIAGMKGTALLESGALTSVASRSLYTKLQERSHPSETRYMRIQLADGHPKDQIVKVYKLPVSLAGQEMSTELVVLPVASSNTTLLGIDFLEDMGIVVDAQHRV